MFAPKKKMSKTRSARRTTAWTKLNAQRLLDTYALAYDAEGNAIGLSHHASRVTGQYRGRSVVSKKAKKSSVTTVRA